MAAFRNLGFLKLWFFKQRLGFVKPICVIDVSAAADDAYARTSDTIDVYELALHKSG